MGERALPKRTVHSGSRAGLQGCNGGPLRQPTLKVHDNQMDMLCPALKRSGHEPTNLPNKAFFVGRNPSDTNADLFGRAKVAEYQE